MFFPPLFPDHRRQRVLAPRMAKSCQHIDPTDGTATLIPLSQISARGSWEPKDCGTHLEFPSLLSFRHPLSRILPIKSSSLSRFRSRHLLLHTLVRNESSVLLSRSPPLFLSRLPPYSSSNHLSPPTSRRSRQSQGISTTSTPAILFRLDADILFPHQTTPCTNCTDIDAALEIDPEPGASS